MTCTCCCHSEICASLYLAKLGYAFPDWPQIPYFFHSYTVVPMTVHDLKQGRRDFATGSVCMSVLKIIQKVVDGSGQDFQGQ